MSLAEELSKLAELRAKGGLTEEEFTRAKRYRKATRSRASGSPVPGAEVLRSTHAASADGRPGTPCRSALCVNSPAIEEYSVGCGVDGKHAKGVTSDTFRLLPVPNIYSPLSRYICRSVGLVVDLPYAWLMTYASRRTMHANG